MLHALVLNATYEPLCVVPLRRAIVLVLAEKASVVEAGPQILHSATLAFPVPTVVRLKHFIRVPYRRSVPLSRRAVLARDGHRCVYCASRAETIDHVVPRSRGGRHEWANVVAACRACNHRKADHLISELGWRLDHRPSSPTTTVALLIGFATRDPSWEPYLVPWLSPAEAVS